MNPALVLPLDPLQPGVMGVRPHLDATLTTKASWCRSRGGPHLPVEGLHCVVVEAHRGKCATEVSPVKARPRTIGLVDFTLQEIRGRHRVSETGSPESAHSQADETPHWSPFSVPSAITSRFRGQRPVGRWPPIGTRSWWPPLRRRTSGRPSAYVDGRGSREVAERRIAGFKKSSMAADPEYHAVRKPLQMVGIDVYRDDALGDLQRPVRSRGKPAPSTYSRRSGVARIFLLELTSREVHVQLKVGGHLSREHTHCTTWAVALPDDLDPQIDDRAMSPQPRAMKAIGLQQARVGWCHLLRAPPPPRWLTGRAHDRWAMK